MLSEASVALLSKHRKEGYSVCLKEKALDRSGRKKEPRQAVMLQG